MSPRALGREVNRNKEGKARIGLKAEYLLDEFKLK